MLWKGAVEIALGGDRADLEIVYLLGMCFPIVVSSYIPDQPFPAESVQFRSHCVDFPGGEEGRNRRVALFSELVDTIFGKRMRVG